MLNRLMTSRRVRGILLTVVLLSAVVAILSVVNPAQPKAGCGHLAWTSSRCPRRPRWRCRLEYYNGLRIQSLLDYPSETAFYQNLCGFLSRAKAHPLLRPGLHPVPRAWRGGSPTWPTRDYGAKTCRTGWTTTRIAGEYSDDRYTSQCRSILQEPV